MAIKMQTGEQGHEILVYGPITDLAFFGDEVTPVLVYDALQRFEGGDVRMRVNSPGGSVFAALAMRSLLVEYEGTVNAVVDGLAASSASLLITGADRVQMHQGSMIMIHDPTTIAVGDEAEMLKSAELLASTKREIVELYTAKTGLAGERVSEMMSAETWLTSTDARVLGFSDETLTGASNVALHGEHIMEANGQLWDLREFASKRPAALLPHTPTENAQEAPTGDEAEHDAPILWELAIMDARGQYRAAHERGRQ